MFRFDAETITEGHGFRRRPTRETPKSSDLAAAQDAPASPQRIKENAHVKRSPQF